MSASSKITYDEDYDRRKMLRNMSFYKLWIMFAFSASAGLMIIGHAANIAKLQAGWEGGFIWSWCLRFQRCRQASGGAIFDKIGRIRLMRIIFMAQALNMLAFSWYNNVRLLLIIFAIIFTFKDRAERPGKGHCTG